MTGETLKNGAVELLRKKTNSASIDIVLAVFGPQFVTWEIDTNGVTRIGNYFGGDLQAALDNFNERI